MRKFGLLGLVFVLLLGGVIYAQDATEEPTEEMTAEPTAEATTDMSMEATAEATADMSTGTSGMVSCSSDLVVMLYIAERYFGFSAMSTDVSLIDKGGFTGLFDNMMNMSGEPMMDMSSMSMNDMSMDAVEMSMVFDEPAECAALRTELTQFFTAVAQQDMNMSAEATAEAEMSGEAMNFSTTLNGANEVPGPGDEDSTGTAALTFDFANSQLCYNVTVTDLVLPAAAMHIHRGNAGESGPVVLPFDQAPDANGVAEGCVVADAALLTEIANAPASFYVNVHNSEFPDGAVRGQVAG